MIRKNVLPLDIYEFKCDEHLVSSVLDGLSSLVWVGNDRNLKSLAKLNTLPSFRGLHQWFGDCVEQVRGELQLPFERLVITQSWANKATEGQSHHRHTHPNSYMSGVFYLTTSEDGRTQFYRPDRWFTFFLLGAEDDLDHQLVHTERPVTGKLLLFPSDLEHSVEPHTGAEPRLSISFNVFPEGRFDFKTDKLRFLNLKVLPFEEDALQLDK